MLWANAHLLLWLSFIPFVTVWMADHPRESTPVAVYGVVLLGSGMAYFVLVRVLLRIHDADSTLATAIGADRKGVLSMVAYIAAIPLSMVEPMAGIALYIVVAIVWLIPDRRITRALGGWSQFECSECQIRRADLAVVVGQFPGLGCHGIDTWVIANFLQRPI